MKCQLYEQEFAFLYLSNDQILFMEAVSFVQKNLCKCSIQCRFVSEIGGNIIVEIKRKSKYRHCLQ